MPEESKESKAKKLAAARKKLKEYQQRGTGSSTNTFSTYTYADSATNSGHVSSNISERSESELQLNGCNIDVNQTEITSESTAIDITSKEERPKLENVNYFTAEPSLDQTETNKVGDMTRQTIFADDTFSESIHNINAFQVLIAEKSELTTELNKYRTLCREKDLEIEELRVQHSNATKRVDDLTQRLVDLQKQQEQQRQNNADLQHKLAQAKAEHEDYSSHISELKQQLSVNDEQFKQLDADFKDKCNALELSQLRIRQLSDENNITKDNRVEALTQTQFMYEQQIRDLQAMVQQLTQDKEQANTQYQTYVQQLNAQLQQLNERNNELTDETTKLEEREKHWIEHIQQLEKEIQKNISRQNELREDEEKEPSHETFTAKLQTLQERINEFESERYQFQLKIKSQEDNLNTLQCELKQKDVKLSQLSEDLENISSEQPDKIKLLATMESDKVAASRALTQNVELKKQLDELELRFVQLTNDKADLMNRLDSEKYANRDMQLQFDAMKERFSAIDERFKFKDEEMIRLSHENEELKKQLKDHKVHHKNESDDKNDDDNNHKYNDCEHYDHDNEDSHEHLKNNENKHDCCSDESGKEHNYEMENGSNTNEYQSKKDEYCDSTEDKSAQCTELPIAHKIQNKHCGSATPLIATEVAVEKLQERFTQLMTQCADLTEEKLRLEHLVMQLQSETETIGEYIALYQTQRRVLKQREYEKAAQTALLQGEREQMRERLTLLDNLVSSLGVELPHNQQHKSTFKDQFTDPTACNAAPLNNSNLAPESVQAPMSTRDFHSPESQQILHKIQGIITEIKENTKELPTMKHSMDQLNCCSGKFEVV